MKNRVLPFILFVFAIGLTFLLFSSLLLHQNESISAQGTTDVVSGKVFKPAARYLAKIRNNQVTGQIDFRDVIKARTQFENFASAGNRDEVLDWSLLGPDNFGGRTRAVLFDKTDANSNTVIAASVSGGLYKSTNLGLTWNKINGWDEALKVSCMVQDDQGNIYAGTGESFATEDFSNFGPLGYNGGFIGTGIHKSTDQNNFTQLEATKPYMNSDTAAWAFINELAFDPLSSSLIASTNRGLRYSTDQGATWAVAKTSEGESLLGNSLDVKVGTDGKIVADIDNLCYISASGNPEMFVLMSRGDSASLPVSGIGRIEYAIAPSNPDIIYASVAKESGALENIYVSDDGGNDWRIIAPGGTSTLNFFGHGTNIGSGQGVYDNCIVVFPNDPFRILFGGVNLWEGKKFNGTGFYNWIERSADIPVPGFLSHLHEDQHAIVFRPGFDNRIIVANDGGVFTGTISNDYYEFTRADKIYYTTQFYTIANSGRKYKVISGAQDNGVITINGYGTPANVRNGTQIQGGDGGYSHISCIDEDVYIVSTYNIGTTTLQRTEDEGASYSNQFLATEITIPDNTFLLTSLFWEDFNNTNSRDSLYFFSRQNSYNAGDQVPVFSKNLGYPFYHTLTEPLGSGDSIMVQDVVATKFFLALTDEVWMTTQAIDFTALPPAWFLISNKALVGYEGNPQCLAASSDGNYLWVGTLEGRLFRISNIALAYNYQRADVRSPYCQISTTEVPLYEPGTTTPVTQAVTSIALDPTNPNRVLVTLGNYGNTAYVMHSTNGLAEVPDFASAQGNLPQMPVYASLIEMSNPNLGIIGTELGTFTTSNIWEPNPEWVATTDANGETIGSTPVFMLCQQTIAQEPVKVWFYDGVDSTLTTYPGTDNYGVIYAATYGRGLFYCDQFQKPVGIGEPLPGINHTGNMNIYPNPVRDRLSIDYILQNQASVQVYIYDINGRMIMQEDLSVQPAALLHYEMNCNALPSGTYIVRLVAGKAIESTKFVVYK